MWESLSTGAGRRARGGRETDPASLPLLQYTLTELYERRDGSRLTLDAYRELGGLAGSVAGRADALCEELGDMDAVRGLFERLVSPGAGTEDTRRRARTSELHGVPPSVIEAFGDAAASWRSITTR